MSDQFRRAPVVITRQTDIGMVLRSDRELLGISALNLDFDLGTENGYIQKCENGGRVGAKAHQSRHPIMFREIGLCWTQRLGRSFVLMDTADALQLGTMFPDRELHGQRLERVKVVSYF